MCQKCKSYVHDVLNTPFPYGDFYYGFYNLNVPKRILPELICEFHRVVVAHDYEDESSPQQSQLMYLSIRLVEEGLVRKLGISYHGSIGRGKPMHMALNWIRYYCMCMKNIRSIHHEHSGHFKEGPMPPLSAEIIERYNKMDLLTVSNKKTHNGSSYRSSTSHSDGEDQCTGGTRLPTGEAR